MALGDKGFHGIYLAYLIFVTYSQSTNNKILNSLSITLQFNMLAGIDDSGGQANDRLEMTA